MKLYVGLDSWVLVTPTMAGRWLGAEPPDEVHQRTLYRSTVDRYVNDRRTSEWCDLVPEPIILTASGFPCEGQHRLTMVVETGLATRFKVIVIGDDVARKIMSKLGTGRTRNAADIIEVKTGSKSARAQSPTARTILALERGGFAGSLAPYEVERLVSAHRDVLQWTQSLPKSRLPACVLGALAFCYPVDPVGVAEFADKLIRKVGVRVGCPTLALARRMETATTNGDKNRYKLSRLVVNAIYHFVNGSAVQVLKDNDSAIEWFASRRVVPASGRMAAE